MEKIIQDMPNDTVAITCNIKLIDKNQNSYGIIPYGFAVGKVDEYGSFVCEDTGEKILPLSKHDEYKHNEEDVFFLYPVTFDELREKYGEDLNSTGLAIAYYRELRENIVLMYKDGENEKLIVEPIPKKESSGIIKSAPEIMIPKKNEKPKSMGGRVIRSELYGYLKDRVKNNDDILEDISTSICHNLRETDPRMMHNILCVGGTGCGKTETVRQIAEYVNLPVTIYDCTKLTAEGYVGDSVTDIINKIYSNAKCDMSLAERSIVCLDEVDKLASRGNDVTDITVQQALLKFVEGGQFQFEPKKGANKLTLDTSLITVIATGAFDGMLNKENGKVIGFSGKTTNNNEEEKKEKKVASDESIKKYGFLPEFVGRFAQIFTYNDLDEQGYKSILTESKISPLLLVKEKYKELYGCEIEYDDAFLNAIIEEAISIGAGARSLNKIISKSFIKLEGAIIDEMDQGKELPKKLVLQKEMIKDPKNFRIR